MRQVDHQLVAIIPTMNRERLSRVTSGQSGELIRYQTGHSDPLRLPLGAIATQMHAAFVYLGSHCPSLVRPYARRARLMIRRK